MNLQPQHRIPPCVDDEVWPVESYPTTVGQRREEIHIVMIGTISKFKKDIAPSDPARDILFRSVEQVEFFCCGAPYATDIGRPYELQEAIFGCSSLLRMEEKIELNM